MLLNERRFPLRIKALSVPKLGGLVLTVQKEVNND
jgi:hypothetical protein